jgi:hypothetical protein
VASVEDACASLPREERERLRSLSGAYCYFVGREHLEARHLRHAHTVGAGALAERAIEDRRRHHLASASAVQREARGELGVLLGDDGFVGLLPTMS